MKNYEFKFMNDKTITEINELASNGHAEAITAYGWECANAGVEGYKKGYLKGSMYAALVYAVAVGGGIAIYKLGKEAVSKLIERRNGTTDETVEVNDACEQEEAPG